MVFIRVIILDFGKKVKGYDGPVTWTGEVSGHRIYNKHYDTTIRHNNKTQQQDTTALRPQNTNHKQCQYQDISTPFQIIFWSTLFILVMMVYSIEMLYGIGETQVFGMVIMF